jgi:SAM-dependent methyltransferase
MTAIPGRSLPYLAVALKLVVVPLLLGVLVAQVTRERWFGSLSIDPLLLVAALAANQVALLFFAARMRSALRVFGMTLGLRDALRVHLQSVFYFFALPMTIGLEVARFAKFRVLLGAEAPAGGLTYALIADRLLGALAALLIVGSLIPFVQFSGIQWQSAGDWAPWAAAALVLFLLASASARVRTHATDLLKMLRSEHRSLWASFGISVATHCGFGLAIYLAARGVGIAIDPVQTLFAVSAAMLFVVVPVSFAGVSPVEAANLGVLLGMGLPIEQAGLFAFLVYLAKLVAAIEGAAWEIAEGGRGFVALARKLPGEEELTSKTIADFGEQWTRYRDNPGYYGSVGMLEDICGPLMPVENLRGRAVADIGSGTGRIVNMLLDAGASRVTAVEPSDAFAVLLQNTAERSDRVTYLNVRGEALPPDLSLDAVVSIGVLHHIPDPTPVVAAAYRALRPGGRIVVWLYGREGNEAYLRVVEPLRALTRRMPHAMLALVCSTLNVALSAYIFVCAYLPLPMRDYMRNHLAKLPWHLRRLTIYDQLNPAYAKYYTKVEAEGLIAGAGFRDVASWHRHGYSWSVAGTKPLG